METSSSKFIGWSSAIVDVDFKFQVNFGAMRVQHIAGRMAGFAEAQVPYANNGMQKEIMQPALRKQLRRCGGPR